MALLKENYRSLTIKYAITINISLFQLIWSANQTRKIIMNQKQQGFINLNILTEMESKKFRYIVMTKKNQRTQNWLKMNYSVCQT